MKCKNSYKAKFFCLNCIFVGCYRPCVLEHFISTHHSLFLSFETGEAVCLACGRPVSNALTDGAIQPALDTQFFSTWNFGKFFLPIHTEQLPDHSVFPGLHGLQKDKTISCSNAILQCIFALPLIKRRILGTSPSFIHIPRHSFDRDCCCVCELERFVNSMYRDDVKTIAISKGYAQSPSLLSKQNTHNHSEHGLKGGNFDYYSHEYVDHTYLKHHETESELSDLEHTHRFPEESIDSNYSSSLLNQFSQKNSFYFDLPDHYVHKQRRLPLPGGNPNPITNDTLAESEETEERKEDIDEDKENIGTQKEIQKEFLYF